MKDVRYRVIIYIFVSVDSVYECPVGVGEILSGLKKF